MHTILVRLLLAPNVFTDVDPTTLQSNFVAFATKWATPLAVIGIILALLAFLVVPILPDWAASMKGYIVRALLIIAVMSVIPSLVSAASGIGGGSAQFLLPIGLPMLTHGERVYTRWEIRYRAWFARQVRR